MRFRTRLATLAAIPALAVATGLITAGAASAASPYNVSFAASPGSSAGWLPNHHAIELTDGGVYLDSSYAIANVHHFGSMLQGTQEPSFNATNYAAGTPRYDVGFSDGTYLFGYPVANGSDHMTWVYGNTTYVSWSDAINALGTKTVTQVYVVADSSQQAPYTSDITNLSWNSQALTSP
jgi:hypothetical protein